MLPRVLACALLRLAAGEKPFLMKAVQVSRSDVANSFLAEMSRRSFAATAGIAGAAEATGAAEAVGSAAGDEEVQARLAELQRELGATFSALPKGDNGTLSHEAVRYTLHRLFVQRHGWFIRGLEPHGSRAAENASSGEAAEEWVPEYLQALLERRERELGESGTSLAELSALAAALEDLASREAARRMEAAWHMHGLPDDRQAPPRLAKLALTTFYAAFLNNGNFRGRTPQEASSNLARFTRNYEGWAEAEQWFHAIIPGEGPLNLTAAQRAVPAIGRRYHEQNDRDCKDLKGMLRGMEGSKAGRVRLPVFYKKALHSHWHFDEKIEYLRALGALDESEPNQPKVITVNYVMARNNCLEASGLYAICCRNECEDLMGHLEEKLGAPDAEPFAIAELVSALSSDTVAGPRTLSSSLLSRLQQVAAANGGKVPLHGRLFAQWMHHAYPRECPFPHEAGTINPQTPYEWMRATGHEDTAVSAQELRAHVERDTCAVGPSGQVLGDCGDSSPELPWSEAEELLVVPRTRATVGAAQAVDVVRDAMQGDGAEPRRPEMALETELVAGLALGLLVVGALAVRILGLRRLLGSPSTGVVCLTVLAWALGLIDGFIFACAALGGAAFMAASLLLASRLRPPAPEPTPKCCV